MVGRMTRRRVIQRAADEALMTPRPLLDDAEHHDGHPAADRDFPPGFGPGRLGDPNDRVRSDVRALALGYRSPPWYQTKRLFTVSAVAVIVSLAVWGIIGVLRSPASGRDEAPALSPPTGESVPRDAPAEISSGEPIEVAPRSPSPVATAEQLRPR
jgi:hypothetical protein